MTDDFFKFPHTPHLAWLSARPVRHDKVLSPPEAREFLDGEVLIEEKIDGANLGISVGPEGELRAQNRGAYLGPRASPQFQPLWPWLETRRQQLVETLGQHLMLFGEWCFAVHSVHYDALPDWFLAFDVYDKQAGRFWSSPKRDALVASLGLAAVPTVARGHFTADDVVNLLGPSRLTHAPMEGIYLRRDEGDFLLARAKIVRPEFVQAIEEHWSSRPLERNTLAPR
ncbi:DNA ligase [Corallococcus sp. CA049B]|uniref:RNA ligase family protein n=1 Tax=Corallococcus sp. CA049B TaxID=2316730 RepID=UPI000EA05139|nr:RNA ligase family protein [Corallococcus sp. CA049B]NOJ95163.1 RNA ligase family protein [Corallococcus coralloides]RKG85371.1 DNA ligase [Corallococcus sp. CA049B]